MTTHSTVPLIQLSTAGTASYQNIQRREADGIMIPLDFKVPNENLTPSGK